jgi:MerR family redox-sensitive transcriptional activator SoxR
MTRRLSIGEVARRSGVATSALRFWEERGLLDSERNSSGHRTYAPDALRRVALITVGTSIGIPLTEIERSLAGLPHDRPPTKRDWERVSTTWRAHLDARIAAMETMRSRLTSCIGCGCLSLRDCSLSNRRDGAGERGSGPRYLLGDEPS